MLENTKVHSLLVQDFDQKEVDLMRIYGDKPLLLIFYNNSCLGCTGRAIPLAYELQQNFLGVQVVGIHSNFGKEAVTESDIKSIFTIDHLPFPIYIDVDHKMYDFFESEGTPQWILLTQDGHLYRSIFGSQSGANNRLYYAIESVLQN
jgi:peroxiredoxin